MKKIMLPFSLLLLIHTGLSLGENAGSRQNSVIHEHALLSDNQLVSINKGTVRDLSRLKGLGVKRAKAIVAYRESHGQFKKIADLVKVKGVGLALLKRLAKNNPGLYHLN